MLSRRGVAKGVSLLCKLLTVFACLALTGCLRSKTVVKVRSDGSGEIIATQVFSSDAVVLFEAQMKQELEDRGEAFQLPDPFFNEKFIKKRASGFGPDVKFIKALKYDKDGARGYVAQYSFKDISKVSVALDFNALREQMAMIEGGDEPEEVSPSNSGMPSAELDADELAVDAPPRQSPPKESFRFAFEKGAESSKLTIISPPVPERNAEEPEEERSEGLAQLEDDREEVQGLMRNGNPLGLTGSESKEQIGRRLLGGMKAVVAFEIEGSELKPASSEKGASRRILFDMDMERLMENQTAMKMLLGPSSYLIVESPLAFYSRIPEDPGFVVEKRKEISIEFK